ncbi:glutaminase domain-containing protein [Paenibacillus solisilvae]|uniref:Glutaminase domain-containing protein n=1 Tax=Paenibacillus solisilvae TaxID=2486751 RepID=A0ABW0VYU4_9BACL
MTQSSFRPPSVPLVTVDPYFSVWSSADRLTDDFTRHWTGQRQAMTGLIRIDGKTWRFAGRVEPRAERYYSEPPAMEQTQLKVTPLSTVYSFEASGVALDVRFSTPLLLDDLDVLSRPASYISLEARSIDGRSHDVSIYYDVTGEWCVDHPGQAVVREQGEAEGLIWQRMSHEEQAYLNRTGDDLRIDWGHFYLCAGKSEQVKTYAGSANLRKLFVRNEGIAGGVAPESPLKVGEDQPVMAVVFELSNLGKDAVDNLVVLAYDDVYAVEYFGSPLQAYWKRNGKLTSEMLSEAYSEYETLKERCEAFDRQVLADAKESGGAKYADILALSYRQAIAAHKLVTDTEGELLFLSKECYSNGCMATVDVSYPSIPLFLLYNPALVEAMIRPIFKYAKSDAWPFEFAPHDIGQYPVGNGQVYSDNAREGQMPVEECGNMLIIAAAACLAGGQAEFALSEMELLKEWTHYLMEFGLDPDNQLCTDDFAGHLKRNANLSVKAIMGVASYSILKSVIGNEEESLHYLSVAKEMASKWKTMADDGDHSKLAFGQEGTWSLKYNLIWDLIFGTGLFGEEVLSREVAWYLERQNEYGTPLDSRATYTKADWLIWSAALAEERNDFIKLVEPLWKMLNDTPDRVPFSDWTDTITARQLNFQHRSVVGGFYIKLLKDKGIKRV